jgi:hypothetical protein
LLWYAVLPFVVLGVLDGIRRERWSARVVVAVAMAVLGAIALLEGNLGLVYRHRLQAFFLLLLFAGHGWIRFGLGSVRRATPMSLVYPA